MGVAGDNIVLAWDESAAGCYTEDIVDRILVMGVVGIVAGASHTVPAAAVGMDNPSDNRGKIRQGEHRT